MACCESTAKTGRSMTIHEVVITPGAASFSPGDSLGSGLIIDRAVNISGSGRICQVDVIESSDGTLQKPDLHFLITNALFTFGINNTPFSFDGSPEEVICFGDLKVQAPDYYDLPPAAVPQAAAANVSSGISFKAGESEALYCQPVIMSAPVFTANSQIVIRFHIERD